MYLKLEQWDNLTDPIFHNFWRSSSIGKANPIQSYTDQDHKNRNVLSHTE